MFELSTVQKGDLKDGTLTSAAALDGQVAAHDVYPGQQITAADFAAGADSVRGELTGLERGITVPLDQAHGMVGVLRAGDHVDIYAGFNLANSVSGRGRPALRTLVQDALVLKVPAAARNANSGDEAGDHGPPARRRVGAARVRRRRRQACGSCCARPPARGTRARRR